MSPKPRRAKSRAALVPDPSGAGAARPDAAAPRLPLFDSFDDDRAAGSVVGSRSAQGVERRGVDVEGLVGIDNGALRLRPLARPGWGREGVSYGPFPRRAGLALAAHVLNGHNASQTFYFPEGRRQSVRRWLSDARRLRFRRQRHHENLAVGWFASEAPSDPVSQGNGFVMHSATADNGELWAGVGRVPMRLVRGVDNLQTYFVVVLRERGAAYYAASLPGANGLGAYPDMRPLAVDPVGADPQVHAGIHQRILGEVGYRVDTRVYGVRVDHLDGWATWWGGAHVADRMTGAGPLGGSGGDAGPTWHGGSFDRSAAGARPAGSGDAVVVVDPGAPSGLVHARIAVGRRVTPIGLAWRMDGNGDGWSAVLGEEGCELSVRQGGRWEVVELDERRRASRASVHSLQVVDDGETFGVHLDGRLVFDRWIADGRLGDATGTGVRGVAGGDCYVRDFEAQPRRVPIPPALDMGAPWSASGAEVAFVERFDTVAGDLAGVTTPSGGVRWERTAGSGVIELTGPERARVKADAARPNPGRTIYSVPWDDHGFVDIEVAMTPPGQRRHQGEGGRGGLVFWQDEDNYLVVNVWVDDSFDGTSVSSFYHLDGHEDMYDAVWTLTGHRVSWGVPCALRVVFDGARFLAFLNGRPTLYRALSDVYPHTPPLEIRRVGLIVNWEWGDDTGTVFHRVEARRRPR